MPQILRILDHGRHQQQSTAARKGGQLEVLGELGVLAIGHAILAQIAFAKMRRDDLQRATFEDCAGWGRAAGRWAQHNQRWKTGGWPDANTEYLLYQTLVGAWPLGNGGAGRAVKHHDFLTGDPGRDARNVDVLLFAVERMYGRTNLEEVLHRHGIEEHFARHLDDRDVKALARALEKVSAHARPLRPGRIAK